MHSLWLLYTLYLFPTYADTILSDTPESYIKVGWTFTYRRTKELTAQIVQVESRRVSLQSSLEKTQQELTVTQGKKKVLLTLQNMFRVGALNQERYVCQPKQAIKHLTGIQFTFIMYCVQIHRNWDTCPYTFWHLWSQVCVYGTGVGADTSELSRTVEQQSETTGGSSIGAFTETGGSKERASIPAGICSQRDSETTWTSQLLC